MTEKRDRVLIIDDEEPVRRTLHQELSGENYLCQKVSSADQALIAVEGSTMGLVIPDIKMLGRSGMELLLEIRAGYPGTAVIMATCIYDASTVVQCMKQGAYDYATKPFDLDEVVLSVRRTLEKGYWSLRIGSTHSVWARRLKNRLIRFAPRFSKP